MHLRLASALPLRSSLGDGVHKAPSPFCKAETKRYMLCPHAYGTDRSGSTCRSGVCRPDRMEVGGRKGHHSLQRSTRSRRAACRALDRHFAGRPGQYHTPPVILFEQLAFTRTCGDELSQFRNWEAQRSRDDRELGRRSRCATTFRTGPAKRSLSLSVPRWPTDTGFPSQGAGIHAARCSARYALARRSHSRWPRHSNPDDSAGAFHRSSGVRGAAASRTCAASAAEVSRSASRKQAAHDATKLHGDQRRATEYRSAHEQARSSVSRARGLSGSFDLHDLALRGRRVASQLRRELE
jgi:hypothetical protein